MESLNHSQITVMFLSLGLLLATARLFGEIAKRLHQPSVLGEILAGIVLGPTILGQIWPEANLFLFPLEGPNALMLSGLATLAVSLFLLVAGMEVDLSTMFRLKRVALIIGITSIVIPFVIGFGAAQSMPQLLGMEAGADPLIFSLFLGIALSICALPVIAKILMDLNLFRSDIGMTIIAVAIFQDLVGWLIFAIILGMMQASNGDGHGMSIGMTIALTLGFASFMLTVGRSVIHRILPWLQAHTSWPGGVLGFALGLGMFGAAFTEFIGIHAIFGAFIVGVTLGDSSHLRQQTRTTIEQFISFIFAPLFFASIGLQVDFFSHFDLKLVMIVMVLACVGKTLGGLIGAYWAGFPRRQSWAMGFALNARGAMEIVLALLALQYGVIGEDLFVALVVVALATALMAGPLMQLSLSRKQPATLRKYLTANTYLPELACHTRHEVIDMLAGAAEPYADMHGNSLANLVHQREQIMSTALPGGLAVPHARVPGLKQPIISVGIIPTGVDWDAPDGRSTKLAIMVLTPEKAGQTQLELLADIASTFSHAPTMAKAINCHTYTCFLAALNTKPHAHEPADIPVKVEPA
ncbi:MAG TPA: cation/H(+) antiporter [Phycisphaerales bacterium]|nr:cation/H(+) antiporter [Phycisphaerales bacterium]|tara:strand:+ start:3805 stop:5547 length:1743 start_codon:yes stop_codon:yes gene_type:complete